MIPVEKPTYPDLLILSFIGAFVAGAFVFVIAEPVTDLEGALDSAGIAFLVVFVLLALLMGISDSKEGSESGATKVEMPEDPEAPSPRPRP